MVEILDPVAAFTKVKRADIVKGLFFLPYPEIAIVEPSEATAISVPSP